MDQVRARLGRLTMVDRVAVGFGLVLIPLFAVSDEATTLDRRSRAIDLGAVAIFAAAAGLLVLRKRHPGLTTLAVVGLGTTWYMVGYTNAVINAPILVALYNLGTTGDRRRQIGIGAVALAIPFVAIQLAADVPDAEAIDAVGYPLAAILLGEIVRSRRLLLAEYAEKAATAEARLETETERRVAEERLHIARDVHDVLAHAVAVMTVQAGVGADAIDRDSAAAKEALAAIRFTGKEAMAELRATVATLRGSDRAETAPTPQLDRLPDLVEGARAQGLDVELDASLPPHDGIESLVQLAAYRVVQESLTNVIRHADATQARVRLERRPSQLVVAVTDDGAGRSSLSAASPPVGFGLRGMRERVVTLGGSLQFGPCPSGGWEVVAVLPVRTPTTRPAE